MDPVNDDYELAAAVALKLRDARAANDQQHAPEHATSLHSLTERFAREVDPEATQAALLPHPNGQLDSAAVAQLLHR